MKIISAETIYEKFKEHIQLVAGDLKRPVVHPAHSSSSELNTIIYLNSELLINSVDLSSPKTVVINSKLRSWALDHLSHWTVFESKNVMLSMALINDYFFPVTLSKETLSETSIHPTAVIHRTAKIHSSSIISAHTVIGRNVTIGENCFIGPNSTIEPNSSIGDNTHIHAQVYIGYEVSIGRFCEIQPQSSVGTPGYGYAHNEKGEHFHIPHYGKVIIHDRVQIGSNVNIDRGTYLDTILHEGSKIDNHCHLAHNFVLGKNSLITAGFITAGSVTIGDNFITGGRTNLDGHLQLCDNVRLAALSTVTHDISKPGAYAGFPLQSHRDAIRSIALITKLPEMKKTLAALKKKILGDTLDSQ